MNRYRNHTEYESNSNDFEENFLEYRRIWVWVIRQVFIDANSNSRKRYARRLKADALSWLYEKGYDMRLVLSFAGLDADEVDLEKLQEFAFQGYQDCEAKNTRYRKNRKGRIKNIFNKSGRGREI